MPPILNFYMDDSGTRKPNRKSLQFDPRSPEFFALGGVLVKEENEGGIRTAYDRFCTRWGITYPLHSEEIRHNSGRFSWLKRDTDDYAKFMQELTRFLTSIDVTAIACVIDRPGYDDRYRARYGRQQWHLCQTAFCIVVERAAKHALAERRNLRVMPERSCKDDEERLKSYYGRLRQQGPPFSEASSATYAPLSAARLAECLYELRFKHKSSPLAQIADLFLWPMVRFGYDSAYRPYTLLSEAGRFIEQGLPPELHTQLGSKYSCFHLVHEYRRRL